MPVDHWWRHDIGYDHTTEARRCHGHLGSGSSDGAGDWTCSWRIPSSSKRMAMDFLGPCYGSKFVETPSKRFPTNDALGGRDYGLSLLLPS